MLKVAEEIEKILKENNKQGIMGFFRTYIPNIHCSYLIEPTTENHTFSSFGTRAIVPIVKVYYLEADVNSDLHTDKRDFYTECKNLIDKFFENPTLNSSVTQFALDVKYSSIKKDKDYKVCEMVFKIEEML